jgi:hypothetical protein
MYAPLGLTASLEGLKVSGKKKVSMSQEEKKGLKVSEKKSVSEFIYIIYICTFGLTASFEGLQRQRVGKKKGLKASGKKKVSEFIYIICICTFGLTASFEGLQH